MDVFGKIAGQYDVWYDTPRGRAIFFAELDALRLVSAGGRAWAEIGVGTGRFASALAIPFGFDVAPNMLAAARLRRVAVCAADATALPVKGGTLRGCLFMMTLCFLADPAAALGEASRALAPGGALVIGFVPRGGAWSAEYERLGAKGHPVYSRARFYTEAEVRDMARAAGFEFQKAASALFFGPGGEPPDDSDATKGLSSSAGFMAMRFLKQR